MKGCNALQSSLLSACCAATVALLQYDTLMLIEFHLLSGRGPMCPQWGCRQWAAAQRDAAARWAVLQGVPTHGLARGSQPAWYGRGTAGPRPHGCN